MQHVVNSKAILLTGENTLARVFRIMTFSVLTAIGAQIEIPHQPVPYTLQTFFVLLSGAMLGRKDGFVSMCAYLGLGLVGIPVFSGAGFGLARIIGPTGGYLLAFPIAAFVVGYLLSFHRGYLWTLTAMLAGLLIIFSLGTMQLNFAYAHDWKSAFVSGFLIFSWWDAVKLVAAATIAYQYQKFIRSAGKA